MRSVTALQDTADAMDDVDAKMLDEKLFWARLRQANDVALVCPLYPRKRTFSEAAFMPAKCQKRTLRTGDAGYRLK